MEMNHHRLKTLFVKRTLLNADDIRAWAKSQGFHSTLSADDMHVTIAFSKEPLDWGDLKPISRTLTNRGGERSIEKFGDATVLCFASDMLHERWQEFRDDGASYDFDEYRPHISISYKDVPENIEPFEDELKFGPEKFSEINDNWADNLREDDL
jgi:hypothetical protein